MFVFAWRACTGGGRRGGGGGVAAVADHHSQDYACGLGTLTPQVAANAAVAAAWRLPLLQGLMARNFTHLPGSGRVRTLLTSVFSHRGALHLTVGAKTVLCHSMMLSGGYCGGLCGAHLGGECIMADCEIPGVSCAQGLTCLAALFSPFDVQLQVVAHAMCWTCIEATLQHSDAALRELAPLCTWRATHWPLTPPKPCCRSSTCLRCGASGTWRGGSWGATSSWRST